MLRKFVGTTAAADEFQLNVLLIFLYASGADPRKTKGIKRQIKVHKK
jgi:hypothetical protein